VEQFQSDDSISVFLISLKAGGAGLNLTGADTVIHFDPWWNPAVEAQATDRAHRIGQKNVVTSIKLIARDTVEQKVLEMQAKKKILSLELLDPQNMASLTAEDVGELIG
jgi:SNF2 family DNA or RNA helicase